MRMDINCDMGESYGAGRVGNDELLMPFISSASVACGYHGGDPATMHRTVLLAKQHGVGIGAHPSFPDLQGFGRRAMQLDPQEVYDMVLYQIGALAAFVRAADGRLNHVKPHGALYNQAAADEGMAAAIANAVYYFDKTLVLFGPPGSALEKAAAALGLSFCAEAFADRTYQADGSLTPRQHAHALIRDTVQCLRQVWQILESRTVTALDGSVIPMPADTICIHGDGLHALDFARAIRQSLTEKGVHITAPAFVHA